MISEPPEKVTSSARAGDAEKTKTEQSAKNAATGYACNECRLLCAIIFLRERPDDRASAEPIAIEQAARPRCILSRSWKQLSDRLLPSPGEVVIAPRRHAIFA
jgi:hypothetical protein